MITVPEGPVPWDKAPEVPLQEGCEPACRPARKVGVGPQPEMVREKCSRKVQKPIDFRLTKEIPRTTQALFCYHYFRERLPESANQPHPVIGLSQSHQTTKSLYMFS